VFDPVFKDAKTAALNKQSIALRAIGVLPVTQLTWKIPGINIP
jgi:hypothetical protein